MADSPWVRRVMRAVSAFVANDEKLLANAYTRQPLGDRIASDTKAERERDAARRRLRALLREKDTHKEEDR